MTKEERLLAVRSFWDHWNDCDDCGLPPEEGIQSTKALCAVGAELWKPLEAARKASQESERARVSKR